MRSHEEDVAPMVGELIPDTFVFVVHLYSCVVAETYEARDQVWSVSRGVVVVILYRELSGHRYLFAVDDVVASVVSDASKFPVVFFVVFVEYVDCPLDWRANFVGNLTVYRRETRGAGRDVLPVLF